MPEAAEFYLGGTHHQPKHKPEVIRRPPSSISAVLTINLNTAGSDPEAAEFYLGGSHHQPNHKPKVRQKPPSLISAVFTTNLLTDGKPAI